MTPVFHDSFSSTCSYVSNLGSLGLVQRISTLTQLLADAHLQQPALLLVGQEEISECMRQSAS